MVDGDAVEPSCAHSEERNRYSERPQVWVYNGCIQVYDSARFLVQRAVPWVQGLVVDDLATLLVLVKVP